MGLVSASGTGRSRRDLHRSGRIAGRLRKNRKISRFAGRICRSGKGRSGGRWIGETAHGEYEAKIAGPDPSAQQKERIVLLTRLGCDWCPTMDP